MPFNDLIGHERLKVLLKASILHDRVAHAYLFHGELGIGKRMAAVLFAQALNCDTEYGPDGPDACGSCRSCVQIQAQTHPDVFVIKPDEERATSQIRIEQIRELEHSIIYRPLIGQWKVCLIDDADRMTLAAANALLKTLEEPPAHSLFLLVSSRPGALPATVRSRCQALRFAAPARTQVVAALILKRALPPERAQWLAMLTEARIGEALKADISDLQARESEFGALTSRKMLASLPDLLSATEGLAKADRAREALAWTARSIRDVLLLRVGADQSSITHSPATRELRHMGMEAPVEGLLTLLERIEAFQRSANRNLNVHLALESILLELRETLGLARTSRPAGHTRGASSPPTT